MDRDSKRKAPATPVADGEARSAKRQRPSGTGLSDETPHSTTEVGLKFVESIKNAKDKTGRPIATEFLTLPDRKLYPAYYEEIRLPIAIDTIEQKLAKHEYPTITALESDFKRMVTNAKFYNDKKSAIYEDAERVRKTASNFFTKHNPAYRDPSYVAVPTPIPGESDDADQPQASTLSEMSVGSHTKASEAPKQVEKKAEKYIEKEEEEQDEDEELEEEEEKEADEKVENNGEADFKGKTFQQAQEQIVDELIHYADDESGLEIFTPFHNLPPRSLIDYYQLIRNPVSLKGIQKRVRGIHGRAPPTWITDFQSWDTFEREISLIWRNAKEYNEDGSEIFDLANELEQYFKPRLVLAKSQVEQPSQPKLKINMGAAAPKQSIKLRLNTGRDSPSTSSRPDTPATADRGTPGVTIHVDALQRQQETVNAGMNGGRGPSAAPTTSQNPFSRSTSVSTSVPALNSIPAPKSNTSPVPQPNGVKTEAQPSPALMPTRVNGHAPQPAGPAMPPQLGNISRTHSGSPAPGPPYPFGMPYHPPPPPTYNGPLKELVANKFRPAGETAEDAILPLLTIQTHPSLALAKPFELKITASPTLTQQSLTVTLPATHTHLLITPHVPVALTSRPYRLFVKVNDNRVSETVKPGVERRKDEPHFEARLERGAVTRIEVEVLAGSKEKKGGKEVVELERCSVFVHVLRA